MGYESKLYVVEKKSSIFNEDKRYGQIIAMIDMCKLGDRFLKALNKYRPTDCYIYVDDGDEETVEDKYGDPLVEIPVKDMVDILVELSQDEDYRRFAPAIGLLSGFNLNEWDDLVVLHYGY